MAITTSSSMSVKARGFPQAWHMVWFPFPMRRRWMGSEGSAAILACDLFPQVAGKSHRQTKNAVFPDRTGNDSVQCKLTRRLASLRRYYPNQVVRVGQVALSAFQHP